MTSGTEDLRHLPKQLETLHAMSQALLKEQAALEATYERVRDFAAEHPEMVAYTEKLEAHARHAIEFAQKVRHLLNAPFN